MFYLLYNLLITNTFVARLSFKITFDMSIGKKKERKKKRLRNKKSSVRTEAAVIYRAIVTDASHECCHKSLLLENMNIRYCVSYDISITFLIIFISYILQ